MLTRPEGGLIVVGDEEITVLVDAADVAGGEPAVYDRGRDGLRQIPVALHYVMAADLNLTECSGGHLGAALGEVRGRAALLGQPVPNGSSWPLHSAGPGPLGTCRPTR